MILEKRKRVKNPSKIIADTVEKLSVVNELSALTSIVAESARALTGADGATFVLRDNDQYYYVDEDAISPLWKGKRFPLGSCISGWSMLNREIVTIADIYQDERIPHEAYRPTFVKSLCMVPIRPENPLGAIGSYWADGYCPTLEETRLLQALANSSAISIENLQLKQSIIEGNHQLIDQHKELEAALHAMAHDLRNPLSTIMLIAEILKTRMIGEQDEKIVGYVDSIVKTGQRATKQISQMLSLYSATHRVPQKSPVDLSRIVSDLIQDFRALSPGREMQTEIEPGLTASADPVLIQSVLENLVSNALKYTSKKQVASIRFYRAAMDDRRIVLALSDNGDGFHPEDAGRLFRPLVRLHHHSEFPGFGLGLASAARIIEMHGGTMRAEGQKSLGATFFFELPLK